MTSLTDVSLVAKAMCSHWRVRATFTGVWTGFFDEDFCRVRKDNSAQNMSVIRKIVMNLLKSQDFSVLFSTKKKKLTIGNK